MRALSLAMLLILAGCGDPDADGDGYPASQDCDDTDRLVNPGAEEVPYDGADNDCAQQTRDDDLDLDGFDGETDCDDEEPRAKPDGEEICDGIDNNCDGIVDNGTGNPFWEDADGDGFGDNASTQLLCSAQDGWVANDDDCDDGDVEVNPDADEVCNGEDDDCDGINDDNAIDATTLFIDYDDDGQGSNAYTLDSCSGSEAGWVTNDLDCNDSDADSYEGATEVCNGADTDCDGSIDDNISATEVCDGVDNDCDGTIDVGASDATTWYMDYDGDGTGDDARTVMACSQPSADYVSTGGDPDDTDSGL